MDNIPNSIRVPAFTYDRISKGMDFGEKLSNKIYLRYLKVNIEITFNRD